jgi:signal transduction histidine kinase
VEEYCRALQVVNQAADVMSRLIQDLLLLARADADPGTGGADGSRDQQELSVAALFERAAENFGISDWGQERSDARGERFSNPKSKRPDPGTGLALRAPARNPKLHAALQVTLPDRELAVRGSMESLVRLLTNLIENAIRHTPADGQIRLSACEAGDSETPGVVITVADTREGIPSEHLPHVCERFYRVDAARSRDQGGAGLGLAIARSITQAHGGTLAIESEVGRGTTVRVTLPLVG